MPGEEKTASKLESDRLFRTKLGIAVEEGFEAGWASKFGREWKGRIYFPGSPLRAAFDAAFKVGARVELAKAQPAAGSGHEALTQVTAILKEISGALDEVKVVLGADPEQRGGYAEKLVQGIRRAEAAQG